MSAYLEAIDDLLAQWGAAAKQGTVSTYYQPGVLGKLKGSTVKSASITEKDYEVIDRAVSELRIVDFILHETATMTYIERRTRDDTARKLRVSNGAVSQYRQSVITFVAGYLNQHET